MGKGIKTRKKKVRTPKVNIQELSVSRNGGQNALCGYSYQFLYSCYLILSSSNPAISFQLEGVEDVDCIEEIDGSCRATHIQLKHSNNKQDASFLLDVLKNFLETYLLDQSRTFKLVYDFPVANGNLSKMFALKLDGQSRTYWVDIISGIKKNNLSWNWAIYDFDKFISHLSFKNIKRDELTAKIEKVLIETYDITTDNVSLFANSIYIFCIEKMSQRAYVTQADVANQIQSVKIDISKGPQNPAHSWIRKLDYSIPCLDEGRSFFEGKKPRPADIASGLPIKREHLENDVIKSICENTVTVIKASSGQGKTTIALQAAYTLRNEYSLYQLLCCNKLEEIGNIVQYFKARAQLGEKILILVDNLDNNLKKWNNLVQLLQSELHYNYKLLITSRELDWYNYSGDLSNIHSIKIIKPTLKEKEATEIFDLFKQAKKLHPSIQCWQRAWNKIIERQLLIEYVYLLTHGEMLAERIDSQISDVGQSPAGKAKCEILRKVCFADLCGIRLSIAKLCTSQSEKTDWDFAEILKSMESEFLVHVNNEGSYIEGLHPIRSKHVVDRLHTIFPVKDTAISVIEIAEKSDISVLFSHLPEFAITEYEFFSRIVDVLWDEKDLSNYISAIQGLFSGNVMLYYLSNKSAFDDANAHNGLLLLSIERCPVLEFGASGSILNDMVKRLPDYENLEYLRELRDRIPSCNLQETDVYYFCSCLYKKLLPIRFTKIQDITSYASISDWILSIDSEFNLATNISLDDIWKEPQKFTLECISTLMYVSYCGNKEKYMKFVEINRNIILIYLKQQTKSHKIFVDFPKNTIHVEYILRLRNIETGNEQSFSRLKYICRMMPIFDLYCADALTPTINLLSAYSVPDYAHKEIPIKSITITFQQNFASLWRKTIMSNYEFDTVTEWLDHWFNVRMCICSLAEKYCAHICKLLSTRQSVRFDTQANELSEELVLMTTGEKLYPKEDRPFEEKATVPEGLEKIKSQYFQSIKNFINLFSEFIAKDKQKQSAMTNLTTALNTLATMQNFFAKIVIDFGFQEKHLGLCIEEKRNIEQLMLCCLYYDTHSPSEYFNKYQIKDWYNEQCWNKRKVAEDALSQLRSRYAIHFPDKIYDNDGLSYYTIIVDNFDLSSESDSSKFIYECLPFTDTSFDYLILLFANDSQVINPTALQLSRGALVDIKNTLESEDYSLTDKQIFIYQRDVTTQMLECFITKYELLPKYTTDTENIHIIDIAEELWGYSKSVELLTAPEDTNYLATKLQGIQTNITGMLSILKDKLPSKDFYWLNNICDSVFSGEKFDDVLFNDVIEYFQQ